MTEIQLFYQHFLVTHLKNRTCCPDNKRHLAINYNILFFVSFRTIIKLRKIYRNSIILHMLLSIINYYGVAAEMIKTKKD